MTNDSEKRGDSIVQDNPLSRADPAENPIIDKNVEKRVLRRLDLTLIPPLWCLFLVSFVDRGNIANAKIQGMSKDLKLTGHKYNNAVMVFTIAYVVFGVPGNIIFRRYGTRTLGVMMFAWGLCAIGQGLTKTSGGLIACRFLMGVFEAGFVPGCAYLIGSYYKRDEFLRRYTVFFSAAIIAGAFNGLFSTLLGMANGAGGLAGWRWIFLVEGIITCVAAILVMIFMLPFPEDVDLFTPREKAVLLERLRADGADAAYNGLKKPVLEALADWKIWVMMLAYIGAEENASAVVAFQPTVLQGLGFKTIQAQIHSIPIYCTAFAVSLICSQLADRLRRRAVFAMVGALTTMVGLAIEIAAPRSVGVRYAGMFFITTGAYITMPIIVVWSAINVANGYKRTVSFGLVIAAGNAGALISSNVFLTSQSPKYHTGFSVGIGMNSLTIICIVAMVFGLRSANRKLDRETVNDDPKFRYKF